MSSSILCQSCNVSLDDSNRDDHYRSELHSINLKRRIADLPPITQDGYLRLKQAEAQKKLEQEALETDVLFICDACSKTFRSEGQFNTHNSSKKHRDTVKALIAERKAMKAVQENSVTTTTVPANSYVSSSSSSSATVSNIGASSSSSNSSSSSSSSSVNRSKPTTANDDELVITSAHCLFCWEDQNDLENNLRHMRSQHSFFIPDIQYCEDPDGLVEYLHAKIIDGRLCLYCDSRKQYESPEAVRQHMRDAGHCMIRYEDDEHFEEFEDYFNYLTAEDEEKYYDQYNNDENNDDDGDAEEDNENEENEDNGNPNSGAIVAIGNSGAYLDGLNLVLPSGNVAHHRSVMRYLKQRYRAPDERESTKAVMNRLAIEYGISTKTTGSVSTSRAIAAAALRKGTRGNQVNTLAQKYHSKILRKHELQTGLMQNDIRTKHLRLQYMGAG